MPYDELSGWMAYFEMRPAGWQEDLRTAYIMQSFGLKKKPEEIFPSLAMMSQNRKTLISKNSNIYQNLLKAKGGDKLNVLDQL